MSKEIEEKLLELKRKIDHAQMLGDTSTANRLLDEYRDLLNERHVPDWFNDLE